MNYPQVLYKFPDYAGEMYLPSNGTEGMIFMDAFCDQCKKQSPTDHEPIINCNICMLTMADGEQPEWIYGPEGWPRCTEWEYWKWERDDDGGWKAPEPPTPISPNQLLIPFTICELFGMDDLVVTSRGVFEVQPV